MPLSCAGTKKHILIIGPTSSVGGIATFIEGILDSQLSQEYFISTFDTGRPTSSVNKNHYDYSLIARIGSLNLVYSLICTFVHLLHFPFVLISRHPDVVHINTASYFSFWENAFYMFVAKAFFRKTILHIHGGRFQDFYKKSNHLTRFLIRSILNTPTKLVVLSSIWQQYFSKFVTDNKLCVIPNYVNLPPYNLNKTKDSHQFRVLFVGGSGALGKGLLDVVNAIPLVVNSCKNVHFIFVACTGVTELQQLLKKKKIIDFVTITDFLQGEEKANAFNNSDIFILPSYAEGLPITMLEAMAYGLPIIASSVGAVPEIIVNGRNGFLIDVGDYVALAEKINTLCKNSELRVKMSHNNRSLIKKYYDESIVLQMLQHHYDGLLHGSIGSVGS